MSFDQMFVSVEEVLLCFATFSLPVAPSGPLTKYQKRRHSSPAFGYCLLRSLSNESRASLQSANGQVELDSYFALSCVAMAKCPKDVDVE